MKLINVPPESLTKELALKVCSNRKFKRKYVSKYKEYFGGSKTLQQEILRKYNELWGFKSEHYKGAVTIEDGENPGSAIQIGDSLFLIGPYIVVLNNPTTTGSECDLQNCIHTYLPEYNITKINTEQENSVEMSAWSVQNLNNKVTLTLTLNTNENRLSLKDELITQVDNIKNLFDDPILNYKNEDENEDVDKELTEQVLLNSYFSCNIDIDGTSGTGLKVLGFFLIVLTQPWTIGSECDLNTCLKIYTITDETIASVDKSGKEVTVTIQKLYNVSKMIVTFTKNGGDELKVLIDEQRESRKKFKELIETAVKTKAENVIQNMPPPGPPTAHVSEASSIHKVSFDSIDELSDFKFKEEYSPDFNVIMLVVITGIYKGFVLSKIDNDVVHNGSSYMLTRYLFDKVRGKFTMEFWNRKGRIPIPELDTARGEKRIQLDKGNKLEDIGISINYTGKVTSSDSEKRGYKEGIRLNDYVSIVYDDLNNVLPIFISSQTRLITVGFYSHKPVSQDNEKYITLNKNFSLGSFELNQVRRIQNIGDLPSSIKKGDLLTLCWNNNDNDRIDLHADLVHNIKEALQTSSVTLGFISLPHPQPLEERITLSKYSTLDITLDITLEEVVVESVSDENLSRIKPGYILMIIWDNTDNKSIYPSEIDHDPPSVDIINEILRTKSVTLGFLPSHERMAALYKLIGGLFEEEMSSE